MAKPFVTLNLAQLSAEAENDPVDYLVDRLIPVGTLNMLAGKPKAGKSTMARQLASCIAKGESFLERATKKSDVLYFASEEIKADVRTHFTLLGLTEGDGVHTVLRQRGGTDFVDRVRETLKNLPKVRLVIIDPLAHFVSGVDLDNYGQVSTAMLNIIELAEECKVSILAAHHTKKVATEEAGDAVLGSSALQAATHTTIFLSGEMGNKRDVRSSGRGGIRLEHTQLEFSSETGSFQLGETRIAVKDQRTAQTREGRADKVLMHIRLRENGITEADLKALVQCSNSDLKVALNTLIEDEEIVRSGSGKRGRPFVYSVPKVSGIELVSKAS